MNAHVCESFGFSSCVSLIQLRIPYVSLEYLSRAEHLKASTVGIARCAMPFFMISSSFLMLHFNRSTVMVLRYQPLSPDISHSESRHSPMFNNQTKAISSSKRCISNIPTEGGRLHSQCNTTTKETEPPSNPKANQRLTAFFTLGINRHVSRTIPCFDKVSTNG